VSPVRYKLGFYIPEDGILHGHRRKIRKSYIALTGWALQRKCNMFRMRYELVFYVPEDGILHGHRSENLKKILHIILIQDFHRFPRVLQIRARKLLQS
jgi:hypothetical protein